LVLSLAFGLWSCGRCRDLQNRYEQARFQLERGEIQPALTETERILRCYPTQNSEWHWRFTVLKAEILHRQGLDGESLALLKPELPLYLASSDIAVRRKLTQAMASAFTQQMSDAGRFLAEAETLAKAGNVELLGEVTLKKGTAAFFRGDMQGAETAYQRALQVARENKDEFLEASALEGLGVVATRKEHYDEGIDWDRSALEVARSAGAQHSLARTLGNMAWCYRKLGEYENALALYNQAEEASRRSGAVGDEIYWLTGIANVYSEQHDYTAAETVLGRALQMARRHDDKDTLTEFLNDLSEIALETGRLELAEKYQKEASEVEKLSPNTSEVLQSLLIRGRISERRGDYAAAEDCFRRLILDPLADSSKKWEAEARLAKVYADESLNAKAEIEFRHSLDAIETVRSSVRTEELRLSFLTTAISFYGDYIEFLISRGRIKNALQVAELSRARTLAEGLMYHPNVIPFSTASFRPQKIASRARAVVLFYWIGEQHSYLWAVTPTKLSYFRLPERSAIEPIVKAYRQAILGGRDVLSSKENSGRQLFAMLVDPARSLIPRNSRVVLVPGESLYGLNFETLIVQDPEPHFWIEDVTLSTVNSLSLLSAASQHTFDKKKNLLLVGNPESANPDFPLLAQGPTEVQKVSSHFPEAKREILLGREATPSAYLKAGPQRFSYLHFVTHGTASYTRPLESAVILSGEGDTYKLYAREIVKYPLSAELVTISACNGTGTRAYAGEGLVGLSWAFLRAGARNVIASLWEVSDSSSTPQLMDALYQGLDRGEDPATALRNAKLSLLRSSTGTVFSKPFYWAAFEIYAGS
jgi:CHAT domain-containing protein/Tfp pilus assembly protein PilF